MKFFKKNLEKIYYIVGEGVAKGGALILFPFFTNYLSKSDFGLLSLYWACIPFLSIFMDFGQRNYIKRIYIEKSKVLRDKFLSIVFFSFLIFLLLLFFYCISYFFDFTLINKKLDLLLIVSAFLFTVIEIYLAFLQIKGDAFKYSIIYVLKTLSPYFITVLVFLTLKNYNILIYPFAQIAVLSLVTIVLIYNRLKKTDLKLLSNNFKKNIKKSIVFGAPMILGSLSATGLNVADRIIINFSEGEQDVANYTVAYTIASILIAFFMATNKWWQRYILVNLNNGHIQKIRNTLLKYVVVVLFVALSIYLFKSQLILLFSNETYLNILSIIPTLLLGMLFYFLYTILLNIPFYYNNTFYVVLPALIAFIINIILNMILIPIKGYEIAALTTTISYFFEFLIIYIISVKVYKIDLFFGTKLEDE